MPEILLVGSRERAAAITIVSEYLETIREHEHVDDVAAEVDGHIRDEANAMWIACEGDEAAGCVAIHPLLEQTFFEIKRLYVRPSSRGRSIGSALMHAAETFAREHGAAAIYLDTNSTMREAVALYGKLGYHRVAPYHETTQADVFLKKQL